MELGIVQLLDDIELLLKRKRNIEQLLELINYKFYCMHCGVEHRVNGKFCNKCGYEFDTSVTDYENKLEQQKLQQSHQYQQQNLHNLVNRTYITESHVDTGAGVLLIERYFNKTTNKYEDVFILIKIKTKFDVGGGERDFGETIINTACRELTEESRNLFKLSPNSLSYQYAVRHTYMNHSFVCFVVFIQGPILSKYYYDNRTIINNSNAGYEWKESTDIIHVTKDQFINSNGLTTQGDLNTVSTDNKSIIILGKAKACIRQVINLGIYDEVIKNGPITLKYNPNFRSSNSNQGFLGGTKVYYS